MTSWEPNIGIYYRQGTGVIEHLRARLPSSQEDVLFSRRRDALVRNLSILKHTFDILAYCSVTPQFFFSFGLYIPSFQGFFAHFLFFLLLLIFSFSFSIFSSISSPFPEFGFFLFSSFRRAL